MSLSASAWINDPGPPSSGNARRTLKRISPSRNEYTEFESFSAYTPSPAAAPTPVPPAAAMVAAATAAGTNPTDSRARVSQMLDKMSEIATAGDDSGLVDFRMPESSSTPGALQIPPPPQGAPPPLPPPPARPQTGISFGGPTIAETFSNYARSYQTPTQPTPPIPEWIADKLTYLIHLAEEQHKVHTRYIAEEFVLYLLLGVFIIYVVDCFSRSNTYRR